MVNIIANKWTMIDDEFPAISPLRLGVSIPSPMPRMTEEQQRAHDAMVNAAAKAVAHALWTGEI